MFQTLAVRSACDSSPEVRPRRRRHVDGGPRAAGRSRFAAAAVAGHSSADQRRLQHGPDQRRRRPRARRDAEAAAVGERPSSAHAPGRRLSIAVGRVDRVQGRADGGDAQRRRARLRDARQPRVRLRHRHAETAHRRLVVHVDRVERRRRENRRGHRQGRAVRRARRRRPQDWIHRPLHHDVNGEPAVAQSIQVRRRGGGRCEIPADAEARRRQRDRRHHPSLFRGRPRPRAEVPADRSHRRRPRALSADDDGRARPHQQSGIGRAVCGADRYHPAPWCHEHGRTFLRAHARDGRDSRRREDRRRGEQLRGAARERARHGRRQHDIGPRCDGTS